MLREQMIVTALNQKAVLRDSYFTAGNATIGTALAFASTATSITDTAPCIVIDNASTTTTATSLNTTVGSVELVLDYILLQCGSSGANSTSLSLVGYVDSANRYSSGGVQLTAVNPHYDGATGFTQRTAQGKVYFGAVTATANTAAKRIFNRQVKVAASPGVTVGDSYTLAFGANYGGPAAALYPTTVPWQVVIPVPRVVIGRGCSFQLYPLAPSNTTALTWEVEVGWIEVQV